MLGPNETLLTNCVSNNFFGVPSLQLLNTAIISLALHGYMGHFFLPWNATMRCQPGTRVFMHVTSSSMA